MTGSVTSVATGPMTGSVPKTGCWARTGLASNVLVMIGAGWMVLMAAGWWTWVCSAIGMVWCAIFGFTNNVISVTCFKITTGCVISLLVFSYIHIVTRMYLITRKLANRVMYNSGRIQASTRNLA